MVARLREAAQATTEGATLDDTVITDDAAVRVYLGVAGPTAESALRLLARHPGTRAQAMTTADFLRHPERCRQVRHLVKRGVEVRLPAAPSRLLLVLADPSASVVQVAGAEPVTVRTPALRSALECLWSGLWAASIPLTHNGLHLDRTSARERRESVLTYLADGVTDSAAAREMDISLRTYRRHVAKVMDELGASSRFHAGAIAVRHGLLGSRPLGAHRPGVHPGGASGQLEDDLAGSPLPSGDGDDR